MPPAFGLLGERVETLGDIGGGALRLLRILQHLWRERTGDRRLLDDEAWVARMQALEDATDPARGVHDVAQITSAVGGLVASEKHGVCKTLGDEIVFERLLVLEVALGLPALHPVERRLSDKEVTLLDQRYHLPVEKGEQQRANMRAVD